jgi:hypothetical protein
MKRLWVGLAVVGGVLLVGGVYALRTWNYVRHDREFCISCHSPEETSGRFTTSGHSELNCRDCHGETLSASLREVGWVVSRPAEVGPHAPVSSAACVRCHNSGESDSTWQRISTTAGHRVHLEADTSALKDVQCLTCHGANEHELAPADQTCGQSGCHEPDKTQVVLGEMAGQTEFHCVVCHAFTAPVPEAAPLDTARTALIPNLENCTSCHEMEDVGVVFDPDVDPHDAVCGTCHNPHTQEAPSEAMNRCAECHAPAAPLTPFHRGLPAGVLENCVGCHAPHTFVVDGKNCVACHADIIGGTPTAGPKAHEPKKVSAAPAPVPGVRLVSATGSRGRAPRPELATEYVRMRSGAARPEAIRQQQGMNHLAHRDVPCTDCHISRETHGQVSIGSGAVCQSCHHTQPVVDRGCAQCHGRTGPSVEVPITIRMDLSRGAVDRQVRFDHDDHSSRNCAECHTQGASMRVERTCASCHQNHHTATASCVTCHNQPNRDSHTAQVHTRNCAGSACHEAAGYGAMTEGRNTCLVCHQGQAEHRPGQACAACHRVSFSSLDVHARNLVAR